MLDRRIARSRDRFATANPQDRLRLLQGGIVTYGKALAACVLAVPLLASSCLDTRPLGTLTAGAGGGQGGDGAPGSGGAGGGPANPPIRVLVWNNGLTYGHVSRA